MYVMFGSVILLVLFFAGTLPIKPQANTVGGGTTTIINPQGPQVIQPSGSDSFAKTQQAALYVGAKDWLNGTVLPNSFVNAELWNSADQQIATETAVNSANVQLTSVLPQQFSGYVMLGNDNFASTTDRGQEYYYRKILVPNTGFTGRVDVGQQPVAIESGITWTGYRDGVSQTTWNETSGITAGATNNIMEVKFAADAGAFLGNPDLTSADHPLAMCFNETTAGTFDYVKPANNDGQLSATPKFLTGKNILSCWNLQTGPIKDSGYYRVPLVIKALPGATTAGMSGSNRIGVMLLDKCFIKDDNTKWGLAYGKDSGISTSTDCGINAVSAATFLSFA